jgi:hypothetical protein
MLHCLQFDLSNLLQTPAQMALALIAPLSPVLALDPTFTCDVRIVLKSHECTTMQPMQGYSQSRQ